MLIGDGLKDDLKVKIEGFGTFSTYFKKIKSVGNTQNEVINAKYISFKPSKKLK
jgi:nucleoid DNA-binding protein|nr:MAG TPA: Bacterial DNA-binding protein [Bacteriophage sp.]